MNSCHSEPKARVRRESIYIHLCADFLSQVIMLDVFSAVKTSKLQRLVGLSFFQLHTK